MSLKELQSSISQLPRADRESLLRFLGQQLADEASAPRASTTAVDRTQWVDELRQLRDRMATGHSGTPLAEILDDLRSE